MANAEMVRENAMFILAILFYLYTISSIIAFIYLHIKKPRILDWTEVSYSPMIIGVFITLCLVLFIGFKTFFHFIPDSWGNYSEKGKWNATRDSVSAILAFVSTCYFFYLEYIVQEKERIIQQLKRKNQRKALILNGSWDRFSLEEKKLLKDDSSALPSELQKKVDSCLGK